MTSMFMLVVEESDLRIPTFHRLTVRPQGYCSISPRVSFHPQSSGGDQALATSPDLEREAGEEGDLSPGRAQGRSDILALRPFTSKAPSADSVEVRRLKRLISM